MRAKEFTYKKTKMVKTVTEFPGISLDLTVQEAANLRDIIGNVGTESDEVRELVAGLYAALTQFWADNGSVRPDIACGSISAPVRTGFRRG